mmetsp:Transcript_19186/g.45776  ORF Transcript_19186/g.45776 Transcript_19186/m.45776 type:complete len:222 (+) Transcript_19186:1158-1823(+)
MSPRNHERELEHGRVPALLHPRACRGHHEGLGGIPRHCLHRFDIAIFCSGHGAEHLRVAFTGSLRLFEALDHHGSRLPVDTALFRSVFLDGIRHGAEALDLGAVALHGGAAAALQRLRLSLCCWRRPAKAELVPGGARELAALGDRREAHPMHGRLDPRSASSANAPSPRQMGWAAGSVGRGSAWLQVTSQVVAPGFICSALLALILKAVNRRYQTFWKFL